MPDKLSLDSILSDYHLMKEYGCRYSWSAKAPVGVDPANISKIDCSGATRYWLLRAGMTTEFPDGSIAQREWLGANGYTPKVYKDVFRYTTHDSGRLFIAGFDLGDTHRHVFLVLAGTTMESAGGLHGVGSRPMEDFMNAVTNHGSCYELPVNLS